MAAFEYDQGEHAPGTAARRGRVSGTVVFDSGDHWLPREWDIRLTLAHEENVLGNKGSRTVTRGGRDYTIQSRRRGYQEQKGHPRSESETEITTTVTLDPPIDPSVFRLAAYGLPELEGLIVRRPAYHLWAIGVGVGCLVAFFIARRWLARRTP